jgi:hypothetical protein
MGSAGVDLWSLIIKFFSSKITARLGANTAICNSVNNVEDTSVENKLR